MIQKDLPYNPGAGQKDTPVGALNPGEVFAGKLVIPADVREKGEGIVVGVSNNSGRDINCSLSRDEPGRFTRADNLRGHVFQSCSWHGGRGGVLDAGTWFVNIECGDEPIAADQPHIRVSVRVPGHLTKKKAR